MTILVTGGTGLVGSRLLRHFVDAGMDCRALVRPGKEVHAGATHVESDLLDADSLKRAVEAVSSRVHREEGSHRSHGPRGRGRCNRRSVRRIRTLMVTGYRYPVPSEWSPDSVEARRAASLWKIVCAAKAEAMQQSEHTSSRMTNSKGNDNDKARSNFATGLLVMTSGTLDRT